MSQVETAIGNGGIIDTVSDLIDKSLVKVQQKGIIGYQVKNLITKGKDIILNNVTTSLKNEMKFQENSIYEIENYINNFLKMGGSNYPIEILKSAKVDMTTKAPMQKVMDRFSELLDILEKSI